MDQAKSSVGSVLKAARERQNQTVERMASELCLTALYLRAIEEDNLDALPGAFFYRSFVRQYAALLNVPLASIQNRLDERVAPPEVSRKSEPVPAPRASYPTAPIYQPDAIIQSYNQILSDRNVGVSAAVLAVVLLACSAFYSWWTRPQLPVAETAVQVTATPVKVSASAQQTTGNAVVTPVADQSIQHADLEISATEQVWLSVTSNGTVLFSGILEPTQTKTLTGVDGAQMKVGNAGGIEVRWKGKPVGPVGPRGQVRTVVLKPDNVEIIQPAPEFSEL